MQEEDQGPFLVETNTNVVVSFCGKTTFCIGRSQRADLDLSTRFTSRNQCRIEKLEGNRWILYDESRYQTTEVNKESVGQREGYILSQGDVISFTFGGPSYRFCWNSIDGPVPKRRKIDENINLNLDLNGASRNSCINLATQCSPSILSQESQEVERLRTKLREITEEIQSVRESAEGNELTISSLEMENKSLQLLVKEMQKRNEDLEARLNKPDQSSSAVLASTSVDADNLETSSSTACLTQETSTHQPLKEELQDAVEELDRLRGERCCQIVKFNLTCGFDSFDADAPSSEEQVIPGSAQPSLQTDDPEEIQELIEDAVDEMEKMLGERCCQLFRTKEFAVGKKPSKEETETIIEIKDNNGPETSNITLTGDSLKNSGETQDAVASPGWKEMEVMVLMAEVKDLRERYEQTNELLTQSCDDKEAFKSNLVSIIETELYCTICSDLIYQATTLNCKHTFCSACINEWKKKKKECPVCRAKLKVEVQCLLVDALADKAVNLLGGEVKDRREQLKKEREEKQWRDVGRRGAGRGGSRRRSRSLVTPAAQQPQFQFLQDLMNLHGYDAIDIRQGDYIIDLTVSPSRSNQPQRGSRRRHL